MPSDAPSLRPATRADLAATREIYNQALRAGGASLDTRERTAEEQERWFADRDPEAIGRSRLVDELSALGVAPGDLLMLHASVAAVGHVIGGPDQVLQALLDRLGPAGTLTMYACWENAPYSMGALPEEVQALYLEEHPAYDPARSPANRGFSILTEYLRTWPGAQRSGHPDGSFVAVGTRAATMVADHPLQYGYGPGSPLDKLCRWGGKVLLLGAPLETVTLLHHAEHMADLPEKRVVRYRMPVLREGRRTWVDLEEYDTGRGLVDYPGGDYFAVITRAYLDAGLGASGRVGAADAHLLDAAKLRDFGVAWMEEHLRPLAEAAASRET